MQPLDITTTAEKVALALDPRGLELFNQGCYMGTTIKVRQIPATERIRVVGSSAGARLEGQDWIIDRFGALGARQVKLLLESI